MTIELSRQKLAELLGAQAAPTNERLSFSGVAFTPDAVRGGELYVLLNNSEHDLNEALNRGAALILSDSKNFPLNHAELTRFVGVKDIFKALLALAKFWYQAISPPSILVLTKGGHVLAKEFLARILVSTSRGSYSLGSDTNSLALFSTIFNLKHEHEWLLINLEQEELLVSGIAKLIKDFNLACVLLAPELNNLTSTYIDFIYTVSQKDDFKALLVPDSFEHLNHFSALKAKICTYSDTNSSSATISVSGLELLGVLGSNFLLHYQNEEYEIKSKFFGKQPVASISAAILTALKFNDMLKLSSACQALQSFPANSQDFRSYKLNGNRFLISIGMSGSLAWQGQLLEIASLEKQNNRGVAFILFLDTLTTEQRGTEQIGNDLQNIMGLQPDFVVAIGQSTDQIVSVAKEYKITSFNAVSPKAAAITASKLKFTSLILAGTKPNEMNACTNELLAIIGEVVEL